MSDFFKRLPTQRHSSPDTAAVDARNSIYRWWWEYLRLSEDYFLASTIGPHAFKRVVDPEFARVLDGFGPVHGIQFGDWFRKRGYKLFIEQDQPAALRTYSFESAGPEMFKDNRLVVSVPITIKVATAVRQFKRELERHREQHGLAERRWRLEDVTTAQFKLHTGRYNMEALSTMFEVWVTHRRRVTLAPAGSRALLWQIGEELKLGRGLEAYQSSVHRQTRERILNATVSRYLRRANLLIANAECGRFPCFDPVPPRERFTKKQLAGFEAHRDTWTNTDLSFPEF